jgi:hypothetical protein
LFRIALLYSQLGNATVRLMLSQFGLELGAGHEVRVPIPAAQFGTRNNGTLYAHILVYRSTKKSLAAGSDGGLVHPKGSPLAVTTAPITKLLAYRARNYTMLLGNWTAGMNTIAADGDTALEGSTAGTSGISGTAAGAGDGDAGEVAAAAATAESTCDAGSGDEEGTCKAPSGEEGTAGSSAQGVNTAAAAVAAAADVDPDDEDMYEPSPAYPMPKAGQLVTHIRPRLSVLVVGSPPTFPHNNLPADIGFRFVKPSSKLAAKGYQHAYRPLLAVDDVSITRREYRMLSPDMNRDDPELLINVKAMNIGGGGCTS